MYELPFGRGKQWLVHELASGWQVSGSITAEKGLPLEITAADTSNTGGIHTQVADRVCDGGSPRPRRPHGSIRPASFSPPPGVSAVPAAMVLLGPGLTNFDISAFKRFPFGEQRGVRFRTDFFSAFNHPGFSTGQTQGVTDSTYGRVTSASNARVIQMSLQLTFDREAFVSNLQITRRELMASAAAQTLRAAETRPNLVYILADDHAGYVLGCDGNPMARTPNLDRLASEGTRFSAHYCNSPVCTPSRQSFLTGQMPHMAGVTRLPTPLAEDKPTLARQLKQAGYATGVFGKMHFNTPGRPGLHGFDVACTEDQVTRLWNQNVKPKPVPAVVATKPAWHPFKDPARIWLNADELPYPRYEADMRSLYQMRMAEEFLDAHKDKPFAMWFSLMEPHSPYDFPLEDRGRVDPERFTAPKVGPEDGPQIPLIFRDLSDKDKRGIIASHYTSVEYVDRNVGRLLDALRRRGLDRNTLIVYHADHGYSLGQHGRFEKHCGYDPALRVPLLMRWPGKIREGVVKDMTEHIDVPATIIDVMNLERLPIQHGQSLRPYLEGRRVNSPRNWIFSEYLENEEAYVRTDRWKFIFCSGKRKRDDGYVTDNPTPGRYVRLFDHKTDPGEFKNVATQNRDVVDKLQKLMLERFRTTHPEAAQEPQRLSTEESLDWYVRPRDV